MSYSSYSDYLKYKNCKRDTIPCHNNFESYSKYNRSLDCCRAWWTNDDARKQNAINLCNCSVPVLTVNDNVISFTENNKEIYFLLETDNLNNILIDKFNYNIVVDHSINLTSDIIIPENTILYITDNGEIIANAHKIINQGEIINNGLISFNGEFDNNLAPIYLDSHILHNDVCGKIIIENIHKRGTGIQNKHILTNKGLIKIHNVSVGGFCIKNENLYVSQHSNITLQNNGNINLYDIQGGQGIYLSPASTLNNYKLIIITNIQNNAQGILVNGTLLNNKEGHILIQNVKTSFGIYIQTLLGGKSAKFYNLNIIELKNLQLDAKLDYYGIYNKDTFLPQDAQSGKIYVFDCSPLNNKCSGMGRACV